jgi:hypothetical protein
MTATSTSSGRPRRCPSQETRSPTRWVSGLAIAGVGVCASVQAIAVLAATYLCCVSVAGICSMSLRQQVTPDYLLGRVTSAFWTIHYAGGPAGAAMAAWAAGHYGVTAVCLFAGGACLLLAAATLFTPIRQANPQRG